MERKKFGAFGGQRETLQQPQQLGYGALRISVCVDRRIDERVYFTIDAIDGLGKPKYRNTSALLDPCDAVQCYG